jgi:hypothetical protein
VKASHFSLALITFLLLYEEDTLFRVKSRIKKGKRHLTGSVFDVIVTEIAACSLFSLFEILIYYSYKC